MSGAGISVIIPSRGLDALLAVCVAHLQAALAGVGGAGAAGHRIVVFDNASPVPYQAAALQAPAAGVEVELLRADQHHCYAAACNLGAAQAPNDWLLMLNNDVLLHPLALRDMLAAAQPSRVGICGTRMVFPDGSIQHCGVVFGDGDRGPFHDERGRPSTLVPRSLRHLQAVTGACMLLRQCCFDALGGFDQGYPFGLEDIDLCLRARRLGWQVVCEQGGDSLHFESMTDGRVAMDVPSRRHFMQQWQGRYSIDAPPDNLKQQ
jgi:GT2 family glycosyltransferase